MGRKRIKIWNFITRLRRPRCSGEAILILLPSCLQNSRCERKVKDSVDQCSGCGRCGVCDIVGLAEKYGCQVAVAGGGRLAMKLAKQDHIEAVVAIACEKELQQGLKGVFPKPALGVVNIRPAGPCRDTEVELHEVERAIRDLIGAKQRPSDRM